MEDGNQIRTTGRLKFFDENKNYGFIVSDVDGKDIFVHYDDLSKA
jgi:cold shock CspA family protein